jgi:hypothetical protein
MIEGYKTQLLRSDQSLILYIYIYIYIYIYQYCIFSVIYNFILGMKIPVIKFNNPKFC